MTTETLPGSFGDYFRTAALGADALGRVYRALRMTGEPGFVRLRILESPELSRDALLDAIEENGEVHGFLKNPAITRGVEMDAVEGVPYIVWNEPNGRTLDALLQKCRGISRKIPVEHALLISEKIATALDHAYNTTIDGERTLHGLVWPGFVAISDDGEIRLSGFGLAAGVLPSIGKPRLAREIAPYLAPEEKERGKIGKNSDVFSVGVILLELLAGRTPPATDPLATLRGTGGVPPPPIMPEIQAVLRMTLGPTESRYASSGDLRRELGKLLFSGPYSPSTFNLAYFLNDLFREEIESEGRARHKDAGLLGQMRADEPAATPAQTQPAAPSPRPARPPRPRRTPPSTRVAAAPSRRFPLALIGGLIVAAAIAGGIFVIARRPETGWSPTASLRRRTVIPTVTPLPDLVATPPAPTTGMTEEEFRDEVSRRLALEVRKLEARIRATPARPSAVASAGSRPELATPPPTIARAIEPAPVPAAPTPPPLEAERPPPTVAPAPTRIVIREGSLVALEETDTPPKIVSLVKPSYPPLALRDQIGGIVLLRVLVSEKGVPLQVDVLREGRAGLTEAAVEAVQKWTFSPATKAGVAVRTWIAVPIPFEP